MIKSGCFLYDFKNEGFLFKDKLPQIIFQVYSALTLRIAF